MKKPHQNTDKSLVQNEAKGSTGAGKSKYPRIIGTANDKKSAMVEYAPGRVELIMTGE